MGRTKMEKMNVPVIGWMTSTTKRIVFVSCDRMDDIHNKKKFFLFPATGWMTSMRTTTKRNFFVSCDRMEDIHGNN
jgi:hypothetical protein